jgi:hypothetical protein
MEHQMKVITSVELSKGYEHWKELFLSNEDFRQKNQINVVAYGHEADNENKVWAVMDIPSMEHMMSLINEPEMIKLREEAGAILETQRMIKLIT